MMDIEQSHAHNACQERARACVTFGLMGGGHLPFKDFLQAVGDPPVRPRGTVIMTKDRREQEPETIQ